MESCQSPLCHKLCNGFFRIIAAFGYERGKVHPRTGHEGPEVWLYSFLNLGARCRWVVNSMARPLYLREWDQVPILQEAGWAPGPVWTGAENLTPTGIRSPDRTTRSESLNRLYPVPHLVTLLEQMWRWTSQYLYGREALNMKFDNPTPHMPHIHEQKIA
jgi:hypothetical protein